MFGLGASALGALSSKSKDQSPKTDFSMVRIEEIVEKVRRNHPQADLNLMRRAYLFSAREHKGQKRASGEAYLVHPLEVANILADMRMDAVSVSTGLLHDVVEDTLADPKTIREYFGEEVAHLVEGLTKISHISNVSREEQQAENVRKMLGRAVQRSRSGHAPAQGLFAM